MRKKLILVCLLIISFFNSYSQKENYIFNVELSNYEIAPKFKNVNGRLIYFGSDLKEKYFFDKYEILKFYQTYPSSKRVINLNMFTFETSDKDLMNDLLKELPNKYLRIEDLSNIKYTLLYYPNDYGPTSPFVNSGVLDLRSYDYVNVPKAWDFFQEGNIGNVQIGLSDGKVNNTDLDFIGKTFYLHPSGFNTNYSCYSNSWHGTAVGAIAAARGNNNHGMVGVCSDCEILNTPYGSYNYLLDLAYAGVDVINMSWGSYFIGGIDVYGEPNYTPGFIISQQNVIDEIHDLGVILVAGAGNNGTYQFSTYPWVYYMYPASYNHVISVGLVQSKNSNFSDELTSESQGIVSWYNQDLITPNGTYINGVFTPNWEGTTTNTRIDICGPGYEPLYSSYLLNCGNPKEYYGNATSSSAPFVTATAALMRSLNSCLLNDEAEDVLQLCSKNIEANPYNFMYYGRLGSGKLETGDAVEFTSEMMKPNGNALVDGQDFWRFDFDLKHILNGLTISNQIFRDKNTTNFTAKNFIEVSQNVDFRPQSGFVDLNIDNNIQICESSSRVANENLSDESEKVKLKKKDLFLFPNPNNGNFTILIDKKNTDNSSYVDIFDILGNLVYNCTSNQNKIDISVLNLPSGIYLVRVYSDQMNEIIKFVKK